MSFDADVQRVRIGVEGKFSRLLAANRPLMTAVLAFLVLRIWFSLLGVVGATADPILVEPQNDYSPAILQELESNPFQRLFLSPWYRFDTVHYLEIAQEGYKPDDHNSAFPPLFSILIRLINFLVPSAMGSAMIVANLAAFISLWLFQILLKDQAGKQSTHPALFWLAVFPTTFLLFQAYTESLFLALTLAILILVQKERWWWAGLLAGLATLTRLVGIFISVIFIWQAATNLLRQKSLVPRKDWIVPLLAGAIPAIFLIAHLIVLKEFYGADMPWKANADTWLATGDWPWNLFIESIRNMIADPVFELQIGRALNLLSAVFVPIALIATRKHFPVGWQIFFWLLYLSSVTLANDGTFHSTFRYALPIIPIYVFLADRLSGRVPRLAGLAICLPLQAGLLLMVYKWIWVF